MERMVMVFWIVKLRLGAVLGKAARSWVKLGGGWVKSLDPGEHQNSWHMDVHPKTKR
jgi:hypothetical protein